MSAASAPSATAPVILGMGNPLLDIAAPVDAAIMEKYGISPGNAVLAEEKHMPLYEELSAHPLVEFVAGGSTLNSMRVAHWVGKDGHETFYVGCIGNDQYGKILQSRVETDGVQAHFLVDLETPTGTCAVCITDKERSLVANLAAANKYDHAHAKVDPVQSVISRADVLYMAGFFLTVSPETILHAATLVSKAGKPVAINLSAPFIPQFFGQQLSDVLHLVDHVFGNDDEATAFAEANKLEDKSVEAIALHIAQLPSASGRTRRVIITRGANETIVATAGSEQVARFPVDLLDHDQIVDLNGAGDAFVGGFLSRLAHGHDLEACVLAGHSASRYIIQRPSTTFDGTPSF